MAPRTRRRWTAWFGGFIAVVVVVCAVIVGLAYSGFHNVSATYPDSAPVAWLLSTTMDRSVRRHASSIQAPSLNHPAMMRQGFAHYRAMCATCHGAPGVRVDEVGRGLNPEPPKLTEAAGGWEPRELFWITKHGIRMTGMPAWGATHSDSETWAIVAFMRRLPAMTPSQYRELDRAVPRTEEHEEDESHSH